MHICTVQIRKEKYMFLCFSYLLVRLIITAYDVAKINTCVSKGL